MPSKATNNHRQFIHNSIPFMRQVLCLPAPVRIQLMLKYFEVMLDNQVMSNPSTQSGYYCNSTAISVQLQRKWFANPMITRAALNLSI